MCLQEGPTPRPAERPAPRFGNYPDQRRGQPQASRDPVEDTFASMGKAMSSGFSSFRKSMAQTAQQVSTKAAEVSKDAQPHLAKMKEQTAKAGSSWFSKAKSVMGGDKKKDAQ